MKSFIKKAWNFLSLILFVSVINNASGQTYNALTLPSANNSFMGSAGLPQALSTLVSVDQFTGTGRVQVPLCDLSSRDLTIPVSLNYVGGRGIRLQDYAGPAGLGWILNAGGGISRIVRGFPDETPNGYIGTGLWGQKVASNANGGALDAGLSSNPPTGDGEPDIFHIKTPFFDLQFTFDENGNAVTSNNSGLQVITHNMYNSSVYYNSSFEVIDDKGNHYYFGSSSASVENTFSTLYGTMYYFPTTWYLDKIVAFNSKDQIVFNYVESPLSDTLYHYKAMATYDLYGNMNMDSTHPEMTVVSRNKYISSIQSPTGEVDFSYAFDRRDDLHAARLLNITLKGYNPQTQTNSNLLKTYSFNYTYFGDPASDPNFLRLRLDNIGITGNDPKVPGLTFKSFTYNTSTNLPTRKAFDKQDYFGFYNYNSTITNYAFPNNSRNQYFPAASANILTGVTDITGATWSLTYELNDYYDGTANKPGCGLRVSRISQTLATGESLYNNYSYVDAAGHSTGQIMSNSYLINLTTWGVGTTVYIWQVYSECPANFYDLNGNFDCYSSVRITGQNGGYTVSTFSNFSDFPDQINYLQGDDPNSIPMITSSISQSYKRGLLLDVYTSNSANNKITEDIAPISSHASQTSPIVKKSYAYKYNYFSFSVGGQSQYRNIPSQYYTNVENYVLTGNVHRDFDQITPSNYIEKSTTYTYSPNNRLVRSISTIDSKGLNYTKTFYYADDVGIPMITSSEQSALTAAIGPGSNATGLLVHQMENRGGALKEVHNSFGSYTYGTGSKILMANATSYNNSTLVQQQLFQYDAASANIVTTNTQNGKPVSTLYGYNNSYPVAKIINASNVYTYTNQPQTQSNVLNIPGGTYGTQYASFSSYYTGTITLTITPGSYLAGGVTCFFAYSLTGPASQSGNLCISSQSGYTCSVPNTVSFSNMPAGNYTLSVSAYTNTATSTVPFTYTFQGNQIVASSTAEFFYEGFEESTSATTGNAHTGNLYSSSNYTTSFTIPNGRSYIIQWWNFAGGKWVFNEQPYTGVMTLTGPVDDIRIFPSDALITTYTFKPLVGQTSEIGPNGQTTTNEYDYLNRLQIVRDLDKNIVRKICYNFAGAPASCGLFYNPVMSQSFTKSCPVGFVGSQVTYSVPANTYVSDINQGHANNLAQDDITANGQNYANLNGTCSCSASFSFAAGISPTYVNQMSVNGSTVSFTFVFACPAGSTSFSLGTILGTCALPTSTRTVKYLIGSSDYNIIISPSGNVSVQWVAGPIASGTVGLTSSYDINLNAFYSAEASGTFQKSCTAPQVGSYVTYTVPRYKYSSTSSQTAADQLATNDVSANGQNYANNVGTCSTPCSFSWSASITNHLQNTLSSSGGSVSFTLSFISPSNGWTGGTIGTITGGCLPSGTRTVSVTDGGNSSRHWNVTIFSNGSVSVSFVSGPATTNTYPPIVLSGSYSL